MNFSLDEAIKTKIRRASFPDERRILMVSDIHGHANGLKTLLKQVSFDEKDILVIVGDCIEKGPENLETLRYVMTLCEQYTVYPIMGNVDLWRLECLFSNDPAVQREMVDYSLQANEWWGASFLGEMYEECGLSLVEPHDTQAVFPLLRKRFGKEIAFIASLPTMLETQDMIFVHGGIPHENLEKLAGTDSRRLMKRDSFMAEGTSFEKTVVVGHTPTQLYCQAYPCANPVIDLERNIVSLDGGCGVRNDGQLNLVILPDRLSKEYTYLTWTPQAEIIALDAQQASADSVHTRWGDDEVQVLGEKDGFATVIHQGRQITLPASLLHERGGKTCCGNFTDYLLPVKPGDRLPLVYTTPYGCYAKKDGVTGWYTGRYRSE